MLGFQACCLEHPSIQSVPNLSETLKNTFHCSHGPEFHFSTNSPGNFWVLKLKSMSAVTVLCQLLSPSHVESGGCCGPTYMAGRVGPVAPGATEVDWAPRGKSQPWADKGFHMSFPFQNASLFFAVQRGFSVHRCDGKAHEQHLRWVSVPSSEPKSTRPVLGLGCCEMIIAFWVVDMEPFSWELLLPWNEQRGWSGRCMTIQRRLE